MFRAASFCFGGGIAVVLATIPSSHAKARHPLWKDRNGGKTEIIVLGCGPSSSVPNLRHATSGTKPSSCACADALTDPKSKDRRTNPSVLLRHPHSDGRTRSVLVDCGKTFREQMLALAARSRHPGGKVCGETLDAVLLTHGHADAFLGLDDLRDMQKLQGDGLPPQPIPVYCDSDTLAVAQAAFPYLVESSIKEQASSIKRFTASLTWNTIQPNHVVNVEGLQFIPRTVVHGEGYESCGFEFCGRQAGGQRFVYLSDVSKMPSATLLSLKEGGPIDVLMVDALLPQGAG
jgi:phosphoribosyl 1,2-cyclic phosphodiesterase